MKRLIPMAYDMAALTIAKDHDLLATDHISLRKEVRDGFADTKKLYADYKLLTDVKMSELTEKHVQLSQQNTSTDREVETLKMEMEQLKKELKDRKGMFYGMMRSWIAENIELTAADGGALKRPPSELAAANSKRAAIVAATPPGTPQRPMASPAACVTAASSSFVPQHLVQLLDIWMIGHLLRFPEPNNLSLIPRVFLACLPCSRVTP